MSQFNRFKTILEEGHSFLLICHVEPDGDAAGSLLALAEGLQDIGKSVCSVCCDEIPDILHFL
ncbi:MAG TPA: bifunctional oligoribonuclease/PAP phosphatase NrnA, partial [bacterium]|nr:bifunctional oligoribonuclease/PAP phosphatase NrnA [bacterium]